MGRIRKLIKKLNKRLAEVRQEMEKSADIFVCDVCKYIHKGIPFPTKDNLDRECNICESCTDICFECYMKDQDHYFIKGYHDIEHDCCNLNGVIGAEYLEVIIHDEKRLDPDIISTIEKACPYGFRKRGSYVAIKCENWEDEESFFCVVLSIGRDFIIPSVYKVSEHYVESESSWPAILHDKWYSTQGKIVISRGNMKIIIKRKKIKIDGETYIPIAAAIVPELAVKSFRCEFLLISE